MWLEYESRFGVLFTDDLLQAADAWSLFSCVLNVVSNSLSDHSKSRMAIITTIDMAARADGISIRKAQNQIQYQGMSGDLYTSSLDASDCSAPAGTRCSKLLLHWTWVANNASVKRILNDSKCWFRHNALTTPVRAIQHRPVALNLGFECKDYLLHALVMLKVNCC